MAASSSAARKHPPSRRQGPRPVESAKKQTYGGRRKAAGGEIGPSGRYRNVGVTVRRDGKRVAAGRRARPAGSSSARQSQARALVNRTPLAYLVMIPSASLLLLGLVMVFSADSVVSSSLHLSGYGTFLDQLAWAGFGVLLLIFFAKLDYHKVGKLSWCGVIVSFVLLVLVMVIGHEAYGAKRWIVVGPLNLQPTEIAKFAMVVFSAYILSVKHDKLKRFGHLFFPVLLFTMIAAGLMLAQPDLGSALVLCFTIMIVLLVARTRPAHLLAVGAAGAAAAMFFALVAPYRRARLFSFINPWKSPKGAGYQVIQSYIALGSGNLKGLGLGMSRQKFLYLPNAHTDFIFSIIGEELGMAGTITVVCLVAMLAYGGMRIARSAPDELGRLLAVGITSMIVIQALVNMGGVTGLLPITGVPLPLVSSGGSSLCVCLACIGILMNIAARSRAQG